MCFKNWSFQKNVNNKKYATKLIFFNEKKSRKIRITFDIKKNGLWKSEIGTFRLLNSERTLIYQRPFKIGKCYLWFNQATIWCRSCLKILKWSLSFISRPYSRQDASKTVQKLEFNTAVKSQGVPPATTKKGSSYKKPAVPPKPRNVVVKQRSSTKLRKSGEILSKKTNVLLQDEKSEQNDSGLSGKQSLFL